MLFLSYTNFSQKLEIVKICSDNCAHKNIKTHNKMLFLSYANFYQKLESVKYLETTVQIQDFPEIQNYTMQLL